MTDKKSNEFRNKLVILNLQYYCSYLSQLILYKTLVDEDMKLVVMQLRNDEVTLSNNLLSLTNSRR